MVSARVCEANPPTSYRQAISGEDAHHWRLAIAAELESLKQCNTWTPLPRAGIPRGAVPIRSKWVFKIKRDTSGKIVRYKAHLVACGYA